MFRFITRKSFIFNLIAAFVFICLLCWGFFASLGWITHHGKYLEVPNIVGTDVDKAIDQLKKGGFEAVVVDSAYNDSLPLNVVKRQLPYPNATVKVNRKIFLNVNPRQLPMIAMPELEGLDKDFAIINLQKNNLKLGNVTERPDFMKGSVLEQRFAGSPIKPGDKIRWGSAVDLVVGGGVEQDTYISVPELIGLTVAEARQLLNADGIIVASIISSEGSTDTANAYIYRQNPEPFDNSGARKQIHPGQAMDVWIQSDRPEPKDSTDNMMERDLLPKENSDY